ncbi:hypothetical protein LC609_04340 [Nostoc sp. XA013]|nr:hypothetical protein [Nostoc sp. XA013]
MDEIFNPQLAIAKLRHVNCSGVTHHPRLSVRYGLMFITHPNRFSEN